ncbi:MAG TPA: glycosyltransferase family 4 protein [Dehalococcoidia bacterium]|nr:glycosyltransferase family 4 protein [Dehalococcoidia bacterium]
MKVIFIPDYSKGNPYQKALTDALSKYDVSVNFGNIVGTFKMPREFWGWRKADVLHLHWQHPFLLAHSRMKTILRAVFFITGLLLLKVFRVRVVWTVHNITSHDTRFRSFELFFCKLLAKLCNRIITHGPSARQAVINEYKLTNNSKVVVIPHGNYIGCYKNSIGQKQARKQLGLENKDLIFLYFGQIRPYKGIIELIEAFGGLGTSNEKLLVVGQPQNSEAARTLAQKYEANHKIGMIFDFVPDDDIQIYMNATDVIVLPYKDILTSGTALLAISFGKPVIAPATGCIPDVLDAEGSFLYDPSDKEGLLKAMQLASGADLKEMGKHNLQLAKKYNWGDIAKKTSAVYKECSGD